MKKQFKNILVGMLALISFSILPHHLTGQTHKSTFRFDGLLNGFTVNSKGQIKVADDDKSIKSISDGGYLEIEKKTFGNSRKLNIYPNSEGKLVYEYKEGMRKVDFEPNGRVWMEEILPDVIRNTGIDIEGRVKRFYSRSGINGILKEIESIESDFISSKYFAVLIRQEKLNENEYKQTILALPEMVSSDFEKSNVFTRVSDYYIANNSLSEAYLSAVSKISSDFEKSRVLQNIRIDNYTENQQINYLNTAKTIGSDFEKSNVLSKLSQKIDLTENSYLLLAKVIETIGSDFEKSNVIRNSIKKRDLNESTSCLIIKAIGTIGSDFEQSNCYRAILTKSPGEKSLIELFNGVSQMNSDFEKGNVLKKASDYIKPKAPFLDAYFNAANSVGSDFEHSGVLKSIIKTASPDEDLFIRIFKSAANISSDFEKSNILCSAALKMPKSEKAKEEYIKTAKTIKSSFEFGNVMKAIY
jgi:hypothetical protein